MKETSLAGRFEAAVLRHPSNTAIYTGAASLTYEELNRRANALASRIRKTATGQQPNIALLLDHNEEMVIGILAALKAGKTYVPIDTSWPLERARTILYNSDATMLVTTRSQLSLAYKLISAADREIAVVNISVAEKANEENPGLLIDESLPAYILYTSGSTGEPKGVQQTNGNVVCLLDEYIRELGITSADTILLTTPYSHTVSVIDLFGALLAGAAVALYNLKKNFDVLSFAQWLQDKQVTIIHTVPTFYRYFLRGVADRSLLASVRLVILGGEEVTDKDVVLYKGFFSDDCLFVNLYGASEVILGTFYLLNKQYEEERKTVPVGFPFDPLTMLILDEAGNPVEGQGLGELYFSSSCLAPVYYKDVAGTKGLSMSREGQSFVRMGDLVKILPDGALLLLGRNDNQIKISGNRVHLSEIEACLEGIPAILQNAVVPIRNEQNEVVLVAYLSTKEENIDIAGIKEVLRSKLPEYMVPSFFIRLETFPLTPGGKIYRNGLPRISYSELVKNKSGGQNTVLQTSILKIWKSALGMEDITIHDNFFQLGGNSLIATEIVNKIYLESGIEVELSKVFDHQTVFEMAHFLSGGHQAQALRPLEQNFVSKT